MIKFIQEFKNAIKQYRDPNTQKAIAYYTKEMRKMDNIFENKIPYSFEKRIGLLEKLKESHDIIKSRNDYDLIKQGVPATEIIKMHETQNLMFIIQAIQSTNPVYDIFGLDSKNGTISLLIDTVIAPNDFSEILDNIYRSISTFEMNMNIEKSYAKNRVCYQLNLTSNDSYKALEFILNSLGQKITTYLENLTTDMEEEAASNLLAYSEKFNSLLGSFDYINKMEFGNKKEICSILNNNILFSKNFINLLNNRKGDKDE